MAGAGRRWTEEELEILRNRLERGWTQARIARHLGRTFGAVQGAVFQLRLSGPQRKRQNWRQLLYYQATARLRTAHPRVWRRLLEQAQAEATPGDSYQAVYSRAGTRLRQRYPREFAKIRDDLWAEAARTEGRRR